jgi:hypothetical protein
MADSKEFRVDIITAATGTGAKETAADLAAVKTQAAEAAPAIEALASAEDKLAAATAARKASGKSSLASDPAAFMGSGGSDRTGAEIASQQAEERSLTILAQRQEIEVNITAALEKRAAGESGEAQILERRNAVLAEAISIETRMMEDEEAALAMAEKRVAAQEAIAAARALELETSEAQDALNKDMVAAEESRQAIEREITLEKIEQLKLQEKEVAAKLRAAEAEAAGQAAMANRLERGGDRMLGMGRDTGMLGALGGDAMLVGGLVASVKMLFDELAALAEEADKKVAEANKRAATSIKELADASKKSLSEARAEAEAYVTALKGINDTQAKGQERYNKEQELSTRRSLNDIDENEIEDLRKESDPVNKEKIKAQSEKARVRIKADADAEAARRRAAAAEQEKANADFVLEKAANEALPGAGDALAQKRASANDSATRAAAATQARIDAEKKLDADQQDGGDISAIPQDFLARKSARKQEESAKALAQTDSDNLAAALSKVNELNNAIRELGEKSAEAGKKLDAARDEQAESAREAAIKIARAEEARSKAVTEAEKREADRQRAKEEHEREAHNQAGAEVAKEDKVESGTAKGAEKGVEAGLSKHTGHDSAPGSRIHAPGAHHEHGGDHAGHDASATDFQKEFHKGLPKAGDPGFWGAFTRHANEDFIPGVPLTSRNQIDTRTSADKHGAQEQDSRKADAAIKDATETIKTASGEKNHEKFEPLIATLKETTAHIKDISRANKDDTKWKELHKALQDQASEIKELRDMLLKR